MRCGCGMVVVLLCRDVTETTCEECEGLHRAAVFVGACKRCERVMERQFTLAPGGSDLP